MKTTILLFIASSTLVNAGMLFHDIGLLALGVLAAAGLYQRRHTLTIQPMRRGRGRGM